MNKKRLLSIVLSLVLCMSHVHYAAAAGPEEGSAGAQWAITITAESAEKEFDGTPLMADGWEWAGDLQDGDEIQSVTVTGSQTEAGSSENVPSDAVIVNIETGENVTDHYAVEYINGMLTVTAVEEPTEDPTEPVEDPTEPVEDPTEPVEDPTEPVEDPTEPVEDPTEPVEDPTEPAEDPTEPAEDPTEPVEDPTEPVEDPTEPVEDPTDPVEDPTEPVEDPTEPVEDPTEPAEDPTEPVEDPTEPLEDPTEPVEDPTEPPTGDRGDDPEESTENQEEGIAIDEINFPDPEFRNYLLSCYVGEEYGYLDSDQNGYLSEEEIAAVTSLYLPSRYTTIESLTGIEFFTALTSLDVEGQPLQSLDLTYNTALIQLNCTGCALVSLDLSNNTALQSLMLSGNQLTELDLSSLNQLTLLECANNLLTTLTLPLADTLNVLICSNNELTSLILTDKTALGFLMVSGNSNLSYLDCAGTTITNLNIEDCSILLDVVQNGAQSTTDEYDSYVLEGVGELRCPVGMVLNTGEDPVDPEEYLTNAYAENDWLYINAGETAVLQVFTEGTTEGLTYSWIYNGKEIEGADAASYETQKYGQYNCTVNDNFGHSFVVRFFVEVYEYWWASIEYSPSNSVPYGETVTMTVNAYVYDDAPAGANVFTYQWFRDLELLEGETNASLQVTVTNGENYQCKVTEETYGRENTFGANVRVDNNLTLTAVGGNKDFAVEPGGSVTLEVAVHAIEEDGLQIQWYADGMDTLEGETGTSLTVENIVNPRSFVCRVVDKYQNNAEVWFNISIDSGLTVSEDRKSFVQAGDSLTLTVEASTNYGPLRYYWYTDGDGTSLSDTASLTLDNITESRWYYCQVSDAYASKTVSFEVRVVNSLTDLALDQDTEVTCGSMSSYEATLRFTPSETGVYTLVFTRPDTAPIYVNSLSTEAGETVNWESRSEWLDSGEVYYYTAELKEGITYYYTIYNEGDDVSVTVRLTTASHYLIADRDSVSDFYLNEGETALMKVRVVTDADSVIYNWIRYDNNGNEIGNLECDGPEYETALPGQYQCLIDYSFGDESYETGIWFYVYRNNAELSVWCDNNSFSINAGDTVTLQANISSSGQNYTIRWTRNGVEIEGAEQATLEVSKAGTYRIIVTDEYGNICSQYFYVDVTGGLTNAYAENGWQYINAGDTAYLHVITEGDTEGLTYLWTRNGEVIEGADADTYEARKSGDYYCTVSDAYGTEYQVYFYVHVDVPWWLDQVYSTSSGGGSAAFGETVTISAIVRNAYDGVELIYKWYKYDTDQEWNRILIEGADGPSLEVTVTEYGRYLCEVTDAEYEVVRSCSFELFVDNDFWSEGSYLPASQVSPGTDVTLSVTLHGNDLEDVQYAWYDVSGERILLEESSLTLTLSNVITWKNICFEATDKYGNTTTAWFYISVDNEFRASAVQELFKVEPGDSVTLEINAEAHLTDRITFNWRQWNFEYECWNDLPDVTGNELNVSDITGRMRYACEVRDGYSGNSTYIEFNIVLDNHLVVEPVGDTEIYVNYGESFTLAVTVTGDDLSGGLTYEWERLSYGYVASGETMNSLENQTESGRYICRVTDAYGNTAEVTFTVAYLDPKTGLAWYEQWSYAVICGIGTCTESDLVIPGTIRSDDYAFTVSSIAERAFENCSNLTSVKMSTSRFTSIGQEAFKGCSSLRNVELSGGNWYLETGVFEDCTALESISITGILEYVLSERAFKNCVSLKTVNLPTSQFSIGTECFAGCTSLTTFNGGNINRYGEAAFRNCSALQTLTLSGNVSRVEKNCFSGCSSLTTVYYGNTESAWNNISIASGNEPLLTAYANTANHCGGSCGSDVTWSYADDVLTLSGTGSTYDYFMPWTSLQSNITAIVVEPGVTHLGKSIFAELSNAVTVSLPDGLQSIGDNAFAYCRSIETVTIPYTVSNIGSAVFKGCDSLTGFVVDSRNARYTAVDGVLMNKAQTTILSSGYPKGNQRTTYTMPNTVSQVEYMAFAGVAALKHITFSENLKEIGEGAFDYCQNLEEILLPNTVKRIGAKAFEGCSKLESLHLPEQLVELGDFAFFNTPILNAEIYSGTIGENAFSYCYKLESITIHDSVNSIAYASFANCDALQDVYYLGTEEHWHAVKPATYGLSGAEVHVSGGKLIQSVTVGDIQIMEGSTSLADNGYGSWQNYDCKPETVTVTTSDGRTFTGDPDKVCEKMSNVYGYGFSYKLVTDQGPDNEWGVGTHEAALLIGSWSWLYDSLGATTSASFAVTIINDIIESVTAEPLTLYQGTGTYIPWDGGWERFDVLPTSISVTMTDGTVLSGTPDSVRDQISASYNVQPNMVAESDQAYDNPWGVGEHEATLIVGNHTAAYTVNIAALPIESVTVADMAIVDGTQGNMYSRWDREDGRITYWNYYFSPNPVIEVTMADGTVIRGTLEEARDEFYDLYGMNPYYFNDSYIEGDDPVGEYRRSVNFAGIRADYTVTIVKNPVHIASIAIDEVETYEGAVNIFPVQITVTLEDGTVYSGKTLEVINTLNEEFNVDLFYEAITGKEVSSLAAGTYPAVFRLGTFDPVDYEVTVRASLIQSVTAADLTLVDGTEGYAGNSIWWYYYEEDGSKVWVKIYNLNTVITVTMKDGTVIRGLEYEVTDQIRTKYGFEPYYNIDNNQFINQWRPGEHTATLSFGGFTADYTVTIIENPVPIASVTVDEAVLYQGYSDITPTRITVTLEDGTEYTGKTYEVINALNRAFNVSLCSDSILEGEGSSEALPVGSYPAAFALGAAEPVDYTITVLASPIQSVTVEPLTVVDGTYDIWWTYDYRDGNKVWGKFFDLYSAMITVTMNDGTVFHSYIGEVANEINNAYGFYPNYGISTDQSVDNQWGVGDHEATLTFSGITTDFSVTVAENPVHIASIIVDEAVTYEGSISILPTKITVTLEDGSVYSGKPIEVVNALYDEFETDLYFEAFAVEDVISTVGNYPAKFMFGAADPVDFTITVAENPIVDVQVIDKLIYEGDYGVLRYGHEEDGSEIFERKPIYNPTPDVIVTTSDGEVYRDNLRTVADQLSKKYNADIGCRYDYWLDQEEHPWTVGSVHDLVCSIGGFELSYTVTIIENQTASVRVSDVEVTEDDATETTYTTDDGEKVTWLYYEAPPTDITLTMKDGTVFRGTPVEVIAAVKEAYGVTLCLAHGSWMIQSYHFDNVWQPGGNYEITYYFGPLTATYNVHVAGETTFPVIITQPEDVTAEVGETVEFTVVAEGEDLSYNWQVSKNGGETWADLSSGISSRHSATLQFTAALKYNGYQYRCQVSEGNEDPVITKAATLTVTAPVTFEITGQPEDVTAEVGETVEFTVVAEGEGLNYRWQYSKDGGTTWANVSTSLVGYNQATMQFTVAEKYNGYQYRCHVMDENEYFIDSEAATLTVIKSLTITEQPENVDAEVGETAVFTVVAEGEGLSYRWYYSKDGGTSWNVVSKTISGYNQATMQFTVAEKYNGYQYRCHVTDENEHFIDSEAATLTVIKSLTITEQPENVDAEVGETAVFTVVAEGEGLSYRWYYSKDGGTSWNVVSKTISGYNQATMQFTVAEKYNGYQYRCHVTDENEHFIDSEAATLTVIKSLEITEQPEDVTAEVGETAVFTVVAEGEGLSYRWYYSKDGGVNWAVVSKTISGYNQATMQFTAAEKYNGYQYRCHVTDENGFNIDSEAATLTVIKSLEITEQPEDVTAEVGETAVFTVVAEGEGLSYRWYYSKDGGVNWAVVSKTISGYNEATMQFTVAEKYNGYQYRCHVTDENGFNIDSEAATLTVE